MHTRFIAKSTAVAVLALTAALAPAWAQISTQPRPDQNSAMDGMKQTLTGTISDSKCKGRVDRKNATLSSCTRQCTHWEGRDYVLLVGDAVYVLNGHRGDLDKFAGERAIITGHIDGNTVLVDSVSSPKKKG